MNASSATLQIDVPRSPAAAAVGSHAARGAMWTLLFSALTKVMTLGSQIALAWFLVPEEFGLAAMALSVMSFTAIVGAGNLKNILIQHSDRFEAKAGQVFWFSLALNAGAALCLAVFAPVAGLLFNDSRVVPLILVGAMAQPLQSLCTIHLAALHRDFRFKRIATIQCVASAVQYGAAVLLAWLGFGAFALVLPLVLVALWNFVALRLSAGTIPASRPQPRQWRALGGPIFWLMTIALFTALLTSGASLVIGLIQQDAATAGFYFWGFSLSSQAVFLLVTNLQGVLFPVLNRLNGDSQRQFAAVEKACRTLLAVAAPVCVLQYLLAAPFITWLFQDRWQPSIGVAQWISLGLFCQPLYLVAASVLMARGRFRRLAAITGFVASIVMLASAVGALAGDQTVIAQCAGASLLIGNMIAGWMVYREFGRGWTQLFRAVVPILGVAVTLAVAGWWIGHVTANCGELCQILTTTLVSLAIYGVLLKLFLPNITEDIIRRISRRRESLASRLSEANTTAEAQP